MVHDSAPPLAAGAASLIEKETSGCGVSYEIFRVLDRTGVSRNTAVLSVISLYYLNQCVI